ncbi:hypothetical protein ACFQ4O_01895 [Methylopila musalis]|uniref:Uncharacterized protein n=1 Tax=Methylopila musalis TaxID=1134781 RepID=A0ABW3Z3E9_9HYPH
MQIDFGRFAPLSAVGSVPFVGLFWDVEGQLVAAGVPLSRADPYGDCLTFEGGHAEYWEAWASGGAGLLRRFALPLAVMTTEYDNHPRGRLVFDRRADAFMIYADRRLHAAEMVEEIKRRFGILDVACRIRSDPHYR